MNLRALFHMIIYYELKLPEKIKITIYTLPSSLLRRVRALLYSPMRVIISS